MKTFKRFIFTVTDGVLTVGVELCFENGRVIKSRSYTPTVSSRWRLQNLSRHGETSVWFLERSITVVIVGKLR